MNSNLNFRRTWDLAEVKRKALDREHEEASKAKKKKLRIAESVEEIGEERESKKYNFGTSSSKNASRKQFFCSICNIQTNDSLSFTSHLSSKNHCKNLGVRVQIKRSNLQQVQDRFKKFKRDKERENVLKTYSEPKQKESSKKKQKKESKVPEDTLNPEIVGMMGFSSFGHK